ncbi:MAG: protein phosphatase 2C domain-containing protein [Pyrinomonadaceae bacterium]
MRSKSTIKILHGAASGIGESHINFPIGYQDAHFCIKERGLFVGIICDGCSFASRGYTQNQVGAIIGAEVIARNLLRCVDGDIRPDQFERALRKANRDSVFFFKRLLSNLRTSKLRIDRKAFIEDKLLFTVIGLLIVKDAFCVFGCGDGFFGVNEDVWNAEKKSSKQRFLEPLIETGKAERFSVYDTGTVRVNDTLWIASDGLSDLIAKERFEHFRQFLNDERTCRVVENNDHTIQPFRQLTLKNRSRLVDDVTIIVAKAKPSAESINGAPYKGQE